MKRTDTGTLITALEILARDVQSEDGVANAALAECAARMQEMVDDLRRFEFVVDHFDLFKDADFSDRDEARALIDSVMKKGAFK